MHASSYIRYLEMSKSCKIDTNSYSETGSLCSSDARKELNLAPNFPKALLIAFPCIEHVWCTETQIWKIIGQASPSIRKALWGFDSTTEVAGSLWAPKEKGSLKRSSMEVDGQDCTSTPPRAGGWLISLPTEKQTGNTGSLTTVPPPESKPSASSLWGEANGYDFRRPGCLPCLGTGSELCLTFHMLEWAPFCDPCSFITWASPEEVA